MNKFKAIMDLIHDAYSQKTSLAGYRRVLKAIAALDLTAAEACAITCRLDYTNELGHPYAWLSMAMSKEQQKRQAKALAKKAKP
jgi:hypothetical protein